MTEKLFIQMPKQRSVNSQKNKKKWVVSNKNNKNVNPKLRINSCLIFFNLALTIFLRELFRFWFMHQLNGWKIDRKKPICITCNSIFDTSKTISIYNDKSQCYNTLEMIVKIQLLILWIKTNVTMKYAQQYWFFFSIFDWILNQMQNVNNFLFLLCKRLGI